MLSVALIAPEAKTATQTAAAITLITMIQIACRASGCWRRRAIMIPMISPIGGIAIAVM